MPTSVEQQQNLEQEFENKYQLLNSAQRQAVDTIEGPVMVIAGPGTGKTQILAMRIANILRNPDLQINPSNILCLTFTESAVTAMRNRLIEIIGSDAYYVRIHTFHSFCNDIIKENPHKFLTINPISDLEQIQILNEIIDDLDPTSPIKPFGEPYLYRSDLIANIKTLKRESIPADDLLEAIGKVEFYVNRNREDFEAFIAQNARKISEEDCDRFIEKLHVVNPGSEFTVLIQEFRDNADRVATFKKQVKDFYERNLRDIPKQRDLVKVYKSYQEKLESRKLYDFEDMILRVIKQFEQDDEILARYQEQFQYILVDEYQDTNGAQNKILELLTSYYQSNANIFVVGDDDQSIYRFQGASLENIIYFYKRYQDHLKLIVLDHNYRSQPKILDISHTSIDINAARITKLIPSISKQLNAAGQALEQPELDITIFKSLTRDDEIYHIAKKVQALIQEGTEPSEIAVLYRENKEADALLDLFAKLGIRARIEAGDNILEDKDIAQLIDLLKVVAKPESNAALLFNLLNYDFILDSKDFAEAEITIRDVFDVNRHRREASQAFIDTLLDHPKFKTWATKLIEFKQRSYNLKLDHLLEEMIKEFGYIDYILKQPDYIQRVLRLESLFREIKKLVASPLRNKSSAETMDRLSLEQFIEHIELLQENGLKIDSGTLSVDANAVRLMTAHKSKGLEFDHVFIYACQDKRWGNKANRSKLKLPPKLLQETESLLHGEANEDDRRVFYVAMTRARAGLYLSYHTRNDKGRDMVPSLFISELAKHEHASLIDFTDIVQEGLADVTSTVELKPSDAELERLQLNFMAREDFAIANEAQYIDSLLEGYKVSVTHLNNYLDCPRRFFYQNLLRVPAAKTKHACFGTAVHNALYDTLKLYKTKHFNSKQDYQDYLLTSFKQHLEAEHLIEQDYEDSLGFGQVVLKQYWDHYYQSLAEISDYELEYDFSTRGVNLDGIEITGKVDKIEVHSDKTVNVVDYKTGNPKTKSAALKPGGEYHRQLVFYQLLCDLGVTSKQFPYTMVSAEVDFIQPVGGKEFIKHKISVTEDDLVNLKSEIQAMYKAVREHKFDKTEDLSMCSNCSFKNICGR